MVANDSTLANSNDVAVIEPAVNAADFAQHLTHTRRCGQGCVHSDNQSCDAARSYQLQPSIVPVFCRNRSLFSVRAPAEGSPHGHRDTFRQKGWLLQTFSRDAYRSTSFLRPYPGKLTVSLVFSPSPSDSRTVPIPYLGCRTFDPSRQRGGAAGLARGIPGSGIGGVRPRSAKNLSTPSTELTAFSQLVRGLEMNIPRLSGSRSSGGTSLRNRDGCVPS